jgi:N-acetyl-anhydromuramyl-L-alanine amidase AmpD
MLFLEAKCFSDESNLPIKRIVIHRAESPVRVGSARAVARWFSDERSRASAHYCVDPWEQVQCVQEKHVAWHAPPNRHSIGIELLGYSKDNDWLSANSIQMLLNAARLVASLCVTYNIPNVWLSPEDLKKWAPGITSHNNISEAFGQTDHIDPGEYFPVDLFLSMVGSGIELIKAAKSISDD